MTRSRARRDVLLVTLVALVARLAVVAWAASFPAAADGTYYHRLATRLAEGHGYTWLWPDGVVTNAAHYPVGYPAMIAVGYALFGAKPVVAMMVNALLGALAAGATTELVGGATSRRWALGAGLMVAVHPALVFYTPAIMTEGATASLLVIAAACARRAGMAPGTGTGTGTGTGERAVFGVSRRALAWLVLLGGLLGVATLVRPQSLALAPLFGLLPARGVSGRVRAAAVVTVAALAVCLPWTARNCVRMEQCALVSVNGGWNLAIGAQTDTGAWKELAVPEPCREVYAEAAKDTCFGREAKKAIAADPVAWLRRAPAKLRVTLDYFGGAPWYLHEADRERFPWNAKVALGTVETVVCRLLLAAALVAIARWPGARRRLRWVVAAVGLVACMTPPGVLTYVALAVMLASLGRELAVAPAVFGTTLAMLLVTFAVHAVFFGAGRYGLVLVPFISALASLAPGRSAPTATSPT